jgi:hypothetical protein
MELTLRVNTHLLSNMVVFRIGNEISSSHMPLLIVIGNMLQNNVNTESFVEKTTHNLVKYKWDERTKSEFLDLMNTNINEY